VTAYVGLGIGRFCQTEAGEMALFWGLTDHQGSAYWPWQGGAREPILAAARGLEKAYSEVSPTSWIEYARTLAPESELAFFFADREGSLRIFGGGEQEARQACDRALRQLLAQGRDWKPLRGMHSPSFVAGPESSITGVLLAGPVLLVVGGATPESSLRDLARFVHRPLPRAPEVGENPLASPGGGAPGRGP
jgi:hypothetical protein